jgi:hypothetical protein
MRMAESVQDGRRWFEPEPDGPAYEDFAMVHSELEFLFFASVQFSMLSIFNGNDEAPRR